MKDGCEHPSYDLASLKSSCTAFSRMMLEDLLSCLIPAIRQVADRVSALGLFVGGAPCVSWQRG